MGFQLQVTGYRLRVTSYELRERPDLGARNLQPATRSSDDIQRLAGGVGGRSLGDRGAPWNHAPHRTRETPITYRLPVPEGVRNKSRERRRAFRTRKFRAYFEQARPIEFRMEDIAFQGLPLGSGTRLGPEDRALLRNTIGAEVIYGERSADILFVITRKNCSEEAISRGRTVLGEKLMVISRDHLSDLLVGLNDREGYTLGLGILRGMDLTAGCITVLTPVREVTRVRAIHFGSLRIDTAGKELGHISVT